MWSRHSNPKKWSGILTYVDFFWKKIRHSNFQSSGIYNSVLVYIAWLDFRVTHSWASTGKAALSDELCWVKGQTRAVEAYFQRNIYIYREREINCRVCFFNLTCTGNLQAYGHEISCLPAWVILAFKCGIMLQHHVEALDQSPFFP